MLREVDLRSRCSSLIPTAVVLVAASALVAWPFVAALVLALWAARLARPVQVWMAQALRGRERAAGAMTALLLLVAAAPIGLTVLALVPAGRELVAQLQRASGGKGLLQALVTNRGGGSDGMVGMAKEVAGGASRVLAVVAGASVEALLGAFVFFAVFHAVLVEGRRWWGWTRDHAPLPAPVLDRLAVAFHQAGRGLLVGTGLTALVQGGLATVLYAAFGVPRALLLGLLTVGAALIPMAGPMLVWIPVAAGLALSGHVGKAAGLAILCTVVVGTIDNILRPWLSRRFEVGLPTAIVLVAMVGGVVLLGGWGLLLGPLVVRLTVEVLRVTRERRAFGA